MKCLAIALCALAWGASWAQAGATNPPADALVPDQSRLRLAIAGNQFEWYTGDSERATPGVTARMRFSEGGLVSADMSTGASDTGSWNAQGSSLCFAWKTFSSGCNAARIAGETIWLQHTNGKWSTLKLIRRREVPVTTG